jgi:two-component system, response regulator PdtaR
LQRLPWACAAFDPLNEAGSATGHHGATVLRASVNFRLSRALGRMTAPSADHPTILVAEDDVLLRLSASELLAESGYTVVEADSAEEALKMMEARNDARLLFTDIQMPPGCDGLELARQVHKRWPNVLLVITLGQVQPTKAEIADHGRFIRKPYRAKELLGEIDELLKKDDLRPLQ